MSKKFTIITAILITANLMFAQIINIPDDYPTIQQGIDAAGSGDTILVQPGIYYENILVSNKTLVKISGTSASEVILDAEGSGPVILLDSDTKVSISNITITGGISISISGGGTGGGIYCYLSDDILLENIIVNDNSAIEAGGWGGRGGGVGIYESDVSMVNSLITNNYSTYKGGGIYVDGISTVILSNVTLSGNESSKGGGIYVDGISTVRLSNVTLTNNESSSGGAIYNDSNSDIYMKNCISYFNLPDELYNVETITEYCNIDGNLWVPILGNIDEDPLFLNTGDHPYRLSAGSPCIDAGTPDTTGLNLPFGDLLGNQRIWDGDGDEIAIVDMGAYEYNSVPVGIKNPEVQNSKFDFHSYPNPVSTKNTIEFDLAKPSEVSIQIYSNLGEKVQEVGNRVFPRGLNKVNWNATNLPAGIYFCQIQIGNEMVTRKIIKVN